MIYYTLRAIKFVVKMLIITTVVAPMTFMAIMLFDREMREAVMNSDSFWAGYVLSIGGIAWIVVIVAVVLSMGVWGNDWIRGYELRRDY